MPRKKSNDPVPGGLRTRLPHTRPLTIVAQDPSITRNDRILTTTVDVPAERLLPGPWGYRVHVIDYDASSKRLFQPDDPAPSHELADPFENVSDERILTS